MAFVISFRSQKAKVITITVLKYIEPPLVVERF